MLGAAGFAVASAAGASAGSVESHGVGISGSVTLAGQAGVNIPETPVSAYPAGPTSDDVTGVAVNGVASTGVITTTADGDPLADTSEASASVNGTNLVSSLVTADAIGSSCTGTGAGVVGASTLANASVGLPLAGRTTLPANPAPNTTVAVATAGVTVAQVVLNEQVATTTGGVRTLVTTALHLKLLSVPVLGLGVGDVRIGTSSCATTIPGLPVLSAIDPVVGPTTGGTEVTLTGSNFLGIDTISFDGVPASFTRDSLTQLTAISPAHAAGPVTVQVVNATGTATAAQQFSYRVAPTLTAMTPRTGPAAGGTSVTITGAAFTGVAGVDFGGHPAASYSVDSTTQITAVSPAGSGTVPVHVTTSAGSSPDAAAGYFTFVSTPVLGGISPTSGPTVGGTEITLNGAGFTSGSSVTIDGAAVPVTVDSDVKLRVVSPAHAAGATDVVVTTAGGSTAPKTYTFVQLPVATAITPTYGPSDGGNTVTITGSGLSDVTSVTAEGQYQTPVHQGDTSLTIVAPPHVPGPVDVFLVGPGSTLTPAGTYTFVAAPAPAGVPVVTSISPDTGQEGTRVTVTGLNFIGATRIEFDGVPATNAHLTSDTQAEADAPAGRDHVTVTVVSPAGTSVASAGSTFTYAPVLTSLDPGNGPITGGTVVELNGDDFTVAATVTVDGTSVPVTYVSPTKLRITTPAHVLPTNAPVVVTVGTASSNALPFSYLALPTVSSMDPTHGPTAGGTTVSLTGLALNVVQSVSVDGLPATDVVQGLTTLTFRTPAHSAGPAQVILDGLVGITVDAGSFFYDGTAPTVTSMTPGSGPLAGGDHVTISGADLTGATLTVGGISVTPVITSGGGTLTFTTPQGSTAGPVPVVVTTGGGTATATYTYLAPPNAVSLSPAQGPTAGGTVVSISGSNLSAVTSVTFGGTVAAAPVVFSPLLLTVVAPAHGSGTVPVVITGPGGTATLPYTYLGAPSVSGMAPNSGPAAGGTSVVITGTGFSGASAVTFGSSAAASFTVNNSTTITAVAPAHTAGDVQVTITGSGGTSAAGSAGVFTYTGAVPTPAPTVTGMTPDHGPAAGGTKVTITGSGFTTATTLKFGSTSAASTTVLSDTTATAITPAHAVGTTGVTVSGPGGTSPARDYTFTGVPTVGALSPNTGLTVGDAEVAITGTGFTDASAVSFGATAAKSFVVAGDKLIYAITPEQVADTVAVEVTTPGGTSPTVAAASFRYLGAVVSEAPDITAVAPELASAAGGTRITIRAANMDSSTQIWFDGVAGTGLRLGDDTTDSTAYDAAKFPFASFDADGDGYLDAYDGTLNGHGAVVPSSSRTVSKAAVSKAAVSKAAVSKAAVSKAAVSKAAVDGTTADDEDYQVTSASVVVPTIGGGVTDVTVTTAAGKDTLEASLLAVPKLNKTSTLSGNTPVNTTTAVHPEGQAEGKLVVTACSTPKHGTVEISADKSACVYTSPSSEVADQFTMSVVNALGETSVTTVKVGVLAAGSGTGTTTDRATTGSSTGTASRSTARLAFTGVPTGLVAAVVAGGLLVLGGFGMLLASSGGGAAAAAPIGRRAAGRPVRRATYGGREDDVLW